MLVASSQDQPLTIVNSRSPPLAQYRRLPPTVREPHNALIPRSGKNECHSDPDCENYITTRYTYPNFNMALSDIPDRAMKGCKTMETQRTRHKIAAGYELKGPNRTKQSRGRLDMYSIANTIKEKEIETVKQ